MPLPDNTLVADALAAVTLAMTGSGDELATVVFRATRQLNRDQLALLVKAICGVIVLRTEVVSRDDLMQMCVALTSVVSHCAVDP